MTDSSLDMIGLSADLVAAYVGNNPVPASQLPSLIAATHAALLALGKEAPREPEKLVPAVPIKKSITPDAIICLEDGRAFKSLKRHLISKYDLTPEQYRSRWGLPADYPMVAPAYAEARSQLAKASGLGRRATKPKARGRAKAA